MYISVDLAHQVIFHAKVGKGGIITDILRMLAGAIDRVLYGLCVCMSDNSCIIFLYRRTRHTLTNTQVILLFCEK